MLRLQHRTFTKLESKSVSTLIEISSNGVNVDHPGSFFRQGQYKMILKTTTCKNIFPRNHRSHSLDVEHATVKINSKCKENKSWDRQKCITQLEVITLLIEVIFKQAVDVVALV